MDDTFFLGEFLYNTMIRGYAYNGPHHKCVHMFDEMTQRGLKPNNFTYPYVLNSLSELGDCNGGKGLHCQIIKLGFEGNRSVHESLLGFYLRASSFELVQARKVFDDMFHRPVELWNIMLFEYVKVGAVSFARELFDEMPERDVVSWNTMISCCARVGSVEIARELFDKIPEKNVVSWTSMVNAYASSGDLDTAREVFEEMPERNVVSWNTMLSNYTCHEKFQEALDLFVRMHSEGVDFDGFSLVSVFTACGHLGALEFGKWVHFYFIKDWFRVEVIVGTSLIEMYAKCGDIDSAFRIFTKLGQKDVFCWNVMIRSLASHGRVEDAIKIFYMMKKIGLNPNDFTFTAVLFACNHGGLVEEGRHIFNSMEWEFGIYPKLNHYGCFIDLLGRNDQLDEAQLLLRHMPFEPDIAVWGAILGGCRNRNDFKLAEMVIEKIDELKTNESGVYVLLSNIYASTGQWLEATRARAILEEKKMWKKAGSSNVVV